MTTEYNMDAHNAISDNITILEYDNRNKKRFLTGNLFHLPKQNKLLSRDTEWETTVAVAKYIPVKDLKKFNTFLEKYFKNPVNYRQNRYINHWCFFI